VSPLTPKSESNRDTKPPCFCAEAGRFSLFSRSGQAHLNFIQRVETNLNNSIDDPFLLKKAPQKESGIILTEGKCSSQPLLVLPRVNAGVRINFRAVGCFKHPSEKNKRLSDAHSRNSSRLKDACLLGFRVLSVPAQPSTALNAGGFLALFYNGLSSKHRQIGAVIPRWQEFGEQTPKQESMSLKEAMTEIVKTLGAEHLAPGLPEETAVAELNWKPQGVLSPDSVAQTTAILSLLEAEGAAVVPVGGGTQIHVGYPPTADRPVFMVRTTRLNRVLDFQPDDMTVTVEPGVTLDALQQTLAVRNQYLPLDVPYSNRATLGGIVSANTSGFWRPAYGTPRDLLIGVRALMTGSVEIKGGGKVVKNVAGYDVCKLFTGAWGTLGILTELTFRTRPKPETERVLAWQLPDLATAARLGLELHHAQLAPIFITVTNELTTKPNLLVGLQGDAARVQWQADEFARRLRMAGIAGEPVAVEPLQFRTLRNGQARATNYTTIAAQVSCLPSDLPAFVAQLDALLSFPRLRITAHSATGILALGAIEVPRGTLQQFLALFPKPSRVQWIDLTENPDNLDLPLWGEEQGDAFLHRSLKQTLDPQNTFSPGRFYGQI